MRGQIPGGLEAKKDYSQQKESNNGIENNMEMGAQGNRNKMKLEMIIQWNCNSPRDKEEERLSLIEEPKL